MKSKTAYRKQNEHRQFIAFILYAIYDDTFSSHLLRERHRFAKKEYRHSRPKKTRGGVCRTED